MDVIERLIVLIHEHTGVAPDSINRTSTMDDLSMDSLDAVELVMAIEEEWGISVEDDAIDNVTTVGHAVSLIERLIGNEGMMARSRALPEAEAIAEAIATTIGEEIQAEKPKRRRKKAEEPVIGTIPVVEAVEETPEEKKSRALTFDPFTTTASAEEPIYMIDTENVRQSVSYERQYGWRDRMRVAHGVYEGRDCYSFTRAKLDRFLTSIRKIVTSRHGSTTRHIDWVRLGARSRIPADLSALVKIPNFPDYPVEDTVGHGSAFPAVAAAILGPVLKKKIVFVNSPIFNERGGFQICIARQNVSATSRIQSVATVLGIEDRNQYPKHVNVYASSGEIGASLYVRDEANGLNVAEVHPNGIFVLVDVQDDFFGIRIFARILQEASRFYTNPEEYERVLAESQRQFRQAQREHIATCARRAIDYVRRNRNSSEGYRNVNRLEHLRQEIAAAEQRLRTLHMEVFAVENENSPDVAISRIEREFDMMMEGRFHMVNKVFFTATGEFHMITDPIIAYDRQYRKYHLLNQCEMIVEFPGNRSNRYFPSTGGVRIVQHVGPGQQRIALPHCGEEGGVCFGNIQNEIHSLVAGFEIQALASMVVTFLQRPNIHDRDGARVRNFPECPAPTRDIAPAIEAAAGL